MDKKLCIGVILVLLSSLAATHTPDNTKAMYSTLEAKCALSNDSVKIDDRFEGKVWRNGEKVSKIPCSRVEELHEYYKFSEHNPELIEKRKSQASVISLLVALIIPIGYSFHSVRLMDSEKNTKMASAYAFFAPIIISAFIYFSVKGLVSLSGGIHIDNLYLMFPYLLIPFSPVLAFLIGLKLYQSMDFTSFVKLNMVNGYGFWISNLLIYWIMKMLLVP